MCRGAREEGLLLVSDRSAPGSLKSPQVTHKSTQPSPLTAASLIRLQVGLTAGLLKAVEREHLPKYLARVASARPAVLARVHYYATEVRPAGARMNAGYLWRFLGKRRTNAAVAREHPAFPDWLRRNRAELERQWAPLKFRNRLSKAGARALPQQ